MQDYKRLTKKDEEYGNFVPNRGSELNNPKIAVSYNGKIHGTIIDRLADLEDKIENGTLIELPCKVGDTVYRVMVDKRIKQPYEYKVIGFWYSVDNKCNDLHLGRYIDGVFVSSISVPFSEFNRMLFLTKAEAEAKLKELQGE